MIDLDRVKERLSAVGLTPNAASEAAGLSRSYVRDMLRGRINNPSALRLIRLADALQTTPAYLLGSDDESWPEQLSSADDRSEKQYNDAATRLQAHIDAVRSSSDHGAPGNRLIFDLLDAVPDSVLVEMVLRFISQNIYEAMTKREILTPSEAIVLMGQQDSEEDVDFSRRMVAGRMAGLINRSLMSEALILSRLQQFFEKSPADTKLDSEGAGEILRPLLKANGLSTLSTETARLAVMSLFARFLDLQPTVPARLLRPKVTPTRM